MNEVCGDNRFEIIEHAKKRLCEATNIEDSPTEWDVVDSFLFRMWQMGWLPGCERTCENLATRNDDFACSKCNCEVVGCMVDDFGSFDNPLRFSYCPNCGVKVRGD